MSQIKSRKWLGAFREGNDEIIRVLESGELGCKYAYILHDKDDTDAHYHYCLWFDNPRSPKSLCTYFKLGGVENLWQVMRSDKYAVAYLTHKNDKDKYQYDESQIHSNFDLSVFDDADNYKIFNDYKSLSAEDFIKKYNDSINGCNFYQKLKIFEMLAKVEYHRNGYDGT